jgi:fucose permease
MRDVSDEGKYSRNLSFGQFVKAIGSLSGALIPLIAVNYWEKDWKILFPIYAVIILITVIYIRATPFKEQKDKNSSPASFSSCLKLLGNPFILAMVLGIFLYVGAEVSMSAKLPNYLAHKFDFDIERLGLWGTLFFFITLMTGRFLGGVILNWLKPNKFLIISSLLALGGIALLFIASSTVTGFTAIALTGLGFANIFPLIFSITIDKLPERANEISGLMVTAIIGGAIMPLVFGIVADSFSLMAGFTVTALSIGYILITSLTNRQK